MKKYIFSCIVASSLVFAKTNANVEFLYAPKNPEHIMPTSNNQVLSYNQAIKEAINSVVNISTKKSIVV